jgi:hypothetical protein
MTIFGSQNWWFYAQNTYETGRFLSSQNAVNYNVRFFVNSRNGAFRRLLPSGARKNIV